VRRVKGKVVGCSSQPQGEEKKCRKICMALRRGGGTRILSFSTNEGGREELGKKGNSTRTPRGKGGGSQI